MNKILGMHHAHTWTILQYRHVQKVLAFVISLTHMIFAIEWVRQKIPLNWNYNMKNIHFHMEHNHNWETQ
jgi:hypothetical protein